MKKNILIATVFFLSLVSCSDKPESSLPQVKTEIYGSSSTESGEQFLDNNNDVITLNYAVYGEVEQEEYELIKRFNEADNGYVIVTKDYSEIAGADEFGQVTYDADKQKNLKMILMQDISKGNIDIVRDYYLGDPHNMDILSARDAFIDLYELMANDSEVNSDKLNKHILKLHETDGKLFALPFYYSIDTLIGQSQFVGSKQGWTLDDFISRWEEMPEDFTINGKKEKDYVYRTILSGMLSSFIDYETGDVHFDSPEFKKALEFCNTFDDINGTYNEPNDNAIDFVISKRFNAFADMHADLWREDGATYTFVGYPSDDGNGGFIDTRGNRLAICASTTNEERQGAWEFLRTYCLEEFQISHYCKKEIMKIDGQTKEVYFEPHGFPMNIKAYDKLSSDAMAGKHMENTITKSGFEFEVGQLTQEELDRLTNYINEIQNLSIGIDYDLEEIIDEEILRYLHNEVSVQECVEVIQNRAQIMVSERL